MEDPTEDAQRIQTKPKDAEAAALELVSRAIRDGDDGAWQTFVGEYSRLVLAHIRRFPSYAFVCEDDDYWLNRTFQRFAQAVRPERLDRFPNLAALLGYLKLCAQSTLLDEVRARRARPHVSLEQLSEAAEAGVGFEESVVQRLTAQELWDAVMQALPNESDRLIVSLSFRDGCKPCEIHAQHSDRFPSVADVYRTKRNVVERLRRDSRLRALVA
ncbi:MAG: sigma-70 family RNA polymerase sigma factor [Chloroflexi bacterium]|nr:MAG: sigma-70 family RNA polymerase sigma factor [Chloroflexota bacterium]